MSTPRMLDPLREYAELRDINDKAWTCPACDLRFTITKPYVIRTLIWRNGCDHWLERMD